MKVTSKGQVTIPQAVRTALGIHKDSEVEFEVKGSAAILRKTRGGNRGERLVQKLRGRSTLKMSTEQIMSMTRGR